MRGHDDRQETFLCAVSLDDRIRADHPIRAIKRIADKELSGLSTVFAGMYSSTGRPSVPPERILKSLLLIALFSIRSERQFCERLNYDLLFRWFLDMNIDEASFSPTVFSKNRDRLLDHNVGRMFFDSVVAYAHNSGLVSEDHFTVDGTLIEAWASLKSFRRKDDDEDSCSGGGRNADVDFRGERRKNETHASATDPESRLMRKGKGKEAKLCYGAHALMENRHGLLLDISVRSGDVTEREAAKGLLSRQFRKGRKPKTLGGDKGYDTGDFVSHLRDCDISPHVAQNNANRRSAIDSRTTRHEGYSKSQRVRKRIEEIFGWFKTIGGFRRTRFKGEARTELAALFVGATYNLLRLAKLQIAEGVT